ncbi:hypothetical protein EKO04_004430 [Ascochyta lentis]|uniref:SH3 domain-containing protein n=1 Tax=Ascochyta lentis TaxID=205686 RepID=A0A8H7J7L7_9PLEO|nr:hypothetical protein EKO04_004430 [Ascochyta lentis]
MGFSLNNPLPSSMRSECRKTGKILASFVDPRQSFGPDKIIPPSVLANAKGLAILTVFKAGFLGTARFGSGVVVARLADGSWSAPSAIGTIGGGFGGQIGFELTDFVFILNDASAVRTFAQAGSLTLGGNVSIAAGPVGRNAEAAGVASLKGVAGVFSYSKTKGLFAGVSPPPPAAEPLLRVLNSRVFSGVGGAAAADDRMYNDIPVYDDSHDNVVWQGRRGSAMGEGVRRDRTGSLGQGSQAGADEYEYRDRPQRTSTWADDVYDRQPNTGGGINRSFSTRANPNETFDTLQNRGRSSTFGDDYSYSDRAKPGRPSAPKPVFGQKKAALGTDQAIAKFTFDPDQPGDLGFKKGEVITILKRTDNETDWWTGRVGDREGIFPSNYVETV